ncbi:hypothetical protein Salat_1435800 [Sesamum alatum]|uniref:Retrotransposon Copia-like N-terminal domain-containing protein n=1 Tax=Sesamum alatum TaxID=300844 RepID=A0AAE1YAH5_9LAMI|nr:hypothetical protein Salat_1435800 [Sesamum alatum]
MEVEGEAAAIKAMTRGVVDQDVEDRDMVDTEFLQIQGIEGSGMTIVTAPMDDTNYLAWSRAIKLVLRRRMKLCFIDGSAGKLVDFIAKFQQFGYPFLLPDRIHPLIKNPKEPTSAELGLRHLVAEFSTDRCPAVGSFASFETLSCSLKYPKLRIEP